MFKWKIIYEKMIADMDISQGTKNSIEKRLTIINELCGKSQGYLGSRQVIASVIEDELVFEANRKSNEVSGVHSD